MRVFDLSHPVHTGMPVFPGDDPVNVRRTRFVARDGYAATSLTLTTHAGTHVDTPGHFLGDAPGLDKLPADGFAGQGVVIDCTALDSRRIEPHHLELPEVSGPIEFVLLHTGWSSHWKTGSYFTDFPYLDEAACHWLADRNLKGIGLDTPSPDPVDSANHPAHSILLGKGMVIVENLRNLGALPRSGFIFSCLPLPIVDGEASPCRAVGMVE